MMGVAAFSTEDVLPCSYEERKWVQCGKDDDEEDDDTPARNPAQATLCSALYCHDGNAFGCTSSLCKCIKKNALCMPNCPEQIASIVLRDSYCFDISCFKSRLILLR